MKTAEKNAKKVQGTNAAAKNEVRTENRPNIPGKDKKDESATPQNPAPAAETKAAPAPQAAPVSAAPVADQPANAAAEPAKSEVTAEVPKTEEAKGGIKYIMPAPNLEQTLKSVDNLHRLSLQRLALLARIKTLETFEVKLVEENDQLESNPYLGCKLTITDDKKREFTTNTPNLIRMVAQFIFDACHEKLADIEAHIVFPQNH